jgi:hypothetical protein
MKNWIAFLLIVSALIAIFFIAAGISSRGDGIDGAEDNLNIDTDKTTGKVVKDDSGINSISGDAIGKGTTGEESSSYKSPEENSVNENNPETTSNRELPSDLNTRPCSFYFLEYEVCAGVCPIGKCLTDGKSCYCKIV